MVAAAKEIGARVRRRREGMGLSQAALAKAAGLSQATVSRIEKGDSDPPVSTAVALCSALSMSLDELFSEKRPLDSESA